MFESCINVYWENLPQGADHILCSDFGFLGVNRKKDRARGDRQRRRGPNGEWVNKRKAKGRDILMERGGGERRRKVEPY